MNTYDEQVRDYLAYCRTAGAELRARGSALDPRYHPTEGGCCKFIPHKGDAAEAAKIREAFRAVQAATRTPPRTETGAP